jgi:hypothetical protein
VVAAVGVGLVLAPVVFQMFTRAPGGATMIDGFRPYMDVSTIEGFQRDLATIDAARIEAHAALAGRPRDAHAAVRDLDAAWPGIDDDMGSMLATMRADIPGYEGVAALPPFALFPWFFVLPGVLLGACGVLLARRRRAGRADGWVRGAAAAVALGLVAAPFAFQMFTRAPGGADMIADFRPFMTHDKVAQIQGYFLTIGAGEGQARLELEPALAAGADVGALATLHREWPRIAGTMAPMIGAMSDNVDNYLGVAALPPFGLFPWFFVVPGVLVVGLVLLRPSVRPEPVTVTGSPERIHA